MRCVQPPDAPCEVGSPPPLVGTFEVATEPFDDPTNLVLPIPRRSGYYFGVLGIGYARNSVNGGVTALHQTYIAFEQLNDAGASFLGSARYVLVDQPIRFLTVLSDGERSVVPPFVGGGAAPFGLVITSVGDSGNLGQLRAFGRWMPRTNAYPGNVRP